MSRVMWCLRQLVPLTYRAYYCDQAGNIHFAAWRMWFGKCFAIDDVIVDPIANYPKPAVVALLEAYEAAHGIVGCDGDCGRCAGGVK